MSELSKCQNVVVKLGGINMAVSGLRMCIADPQPPLRATRGRD